MHIRQLTIFTSQLGIQRKFYAETMGLPLKNETPDAVSFAIGKSGFTLKEKAHATPYHFAINIPSEDEEKALQWLKERVGVLAAQGSEIQDFSSWNAKSVYFYDPDKNIVEFIARRNLRYPPVQPFGHRSMLEVSEIGLAVDDIPPYFAQLNTQLGLERYDGNMEQFGAVGDENGLFICINRHKKTWYPTGDKAYPSGFELLVAHKGSEFLVSYQKGTLKITPLHA